MKRSCWGRALCGVLIAATAIGSNPSGDRAAQAFASTPVVRRVPFIGTFVVTAAWGNATGANHATPAIDFKMPIGTPIYATAAGNVDFVSNDPRNCNPLTHIPKNGTYADAIQWCIDHGLSGTRIRIRHDDGTFSMYVHLSKVRAGVAARPSTRVVAGELIAWSGNSGISTGPHLHYSKINAQGSATVDPVKLVGCWGSTRHDFVNLKTLVGKSIRNDNYTC